jgi:cell division protease FtsH
LPENDRLSYSKKTLESKISTMFGGRIAEALIFGPESVTNGASQDIKQATDIARSMVTKWGLSERLGPLTYGEDDSEIFLGHSVTQHKMLSDETAHVIDEEIRSFIDRNYQRAERLLNENLNFLHAMADALLKYETLDSDQLDDVMVGKTPRPPKDWNDSNNNNDKNIEPKVNDKVVEGIKTKIGGPASSH